MAIEYPGVLCTNLLWGSREAIGTQNPLVLANNPTCLYGQHKRGVYFYMARLAQAGQQLLSGGAATQALLVAKK